jgi:uncharacterized lipoprotein YddW (UPF0748 family)
MVMTMANKFNSIFLDISPSVKVFDRTYTMRLIEDVKKINKELEKRGFSFNSIGVAVKQETGKVCYNSHDVASIKRECGEFLSTFVDSAEKAGFQPYAWILCFVDEKARIFSNKSKKEFRMVKRSGKILDNVHICPTVPEYHEYLLRVFEEVANYKGLKGIGLEPIHYRSYDLCFCETCKKLFAQEAGTNAKLKDDFFAAPSLNWVNWKSNNLSDFLKAAVDRINKIRKGIEIIPKLYWDPLSYGLGTKIKLGQDPETWKNIKGLNLAIDALPDGYPTSEEDRFEFYMSLHSSFKSLKNKYLYLYWDEALQWIDVVNEFKKTFDPKGVIIATTPGTAVGLS